MSRRILLLGHSGVEKAHVVESLRALWGAIVEHREEIMKQVELVEVAESPALKNRYTLPFIETRDGYRYSGMDAIRRFAERLRDGRATPGEL
jgi:hypothetical protein